MKPALSTLDSNLVCNLDSSVGSSVDSNLDSMGPTLRASGCSGWLGGGGAMLRTAYVIISFLQQYAHHGCSLA